jgi:hypothetical protein
MRLIIYCKMKIGLRYCITGEKIVTIWKQLPKNYELRRDFSFIFYEDNG